MHVLVVFGNGGRLLFMAFYMITLMSACVAYITRIALVTLKNINNTLLIYNWWLCFFDILFLFNFLAYKHRLDGGVYF